MYLTTTMSLFDDVLAHLPSEAAHAKEDEKAIMQPFAYTAAHKGKDIRGKLIAGLNLWLSVPPQAAQLTRRLSPTCTPRRSC